MYLGTVYSGGEITLDVTLDVPLTLDNTFQQAIGYLDWCFKVEELPVEPDDPKPPQTGDRFNLPFFVILAGMSGLALLLLLVVKRRSGTQEH